MTPEDECEREVFVEMPWEHKRTLAVPLSQLEVAHTDEETRQAVEDWHYWVAMGYELLIGRSHCRPARVSHSGNPTVA